MTKREGQEIIRTAMKEMLDDNEHFLFVLEACQRYSDTSSEHFVRFANEMNQKLIEKGMDPRADPTGE